MSAGEVDFTTGDLDEVVTRLRALDEAAAGWVNVRPVIEEGDLPPKPGLPSLFSPRTPALPVGTWVPGPRGRDGARKPSSLGVQHPTGKKVASRLVEAGLRPPADWRGVQDHPRRGLVLEVPPGTDPREVLRWTLAVLSELSPLPLRGEWRATLEG